MKRNRAATDPSEFPDPPTKSKKGCKDLTAKEAGRARPAAAQKPRNKNGDESKPADVAFLGSLVAEQQEEGQLLLDGDEELGWLWGWGVEEDLLLGWFPFVDEHFLWSESRGGSGLFWEEDHDIWQLLHIHEIPNSAK